MLQKKKIKASFETTKKGCQHLDCPVKYPAYGFEKGKATHCATHAFSEMWNVINKNCAYDGCSVRPTYGLEKGKSNLTEYI